MTLRFDHAVIATRNLDRAAEAYRQLGFAVEPGGRHTGKGTRNALVRFPSDYLELIAVDDRAEALAAGPSRVALVRFLDRSEAGLSTFALRTAAAPDLDELATRWRAAGFVVAGPTPAERVRPDGSILRWRTAVPGGSSVREIWPFVIDWPDGALPDPPPADRHPNGALGVAGVAVLGADSAIVAQYARLGLAPAPVDVDETAGGDPRRAVVRLPGCSLDLLVPERGGRLAARLRQEGPGPMQVTVLVRDLDALAIQLRAGGYRTVAAWPAGLRIADAEPVVEPLVFVERAA